MAMRKRTVVGLLALVLLGCGTVPVKIGNDAKCAGCAAPALDLLARGFLVRGEEPQEGFGYYAYLVFADAGETSRPQREAAIAAFVRLMEDARDIDQLEIPRDRVAILYVLVKEPLAVTAPAEKVLQAYDYTRATLLTRELSKHTRLPRLFLVGAPGPIRKDAPLPREVRVVELSGDAQAIEATVLQFRTSLLAPDRPAVAQAMLERVRAFFESVGGFVLSVGSLGTSPGKP